MSFSYVGRFAPSPSGPLHLGSLVSALASYLDAKKNQGKWLIRIEDIDHERCKAEHIPDIIDTLASYQLTSDDEIVKQSSRLSLYQAALDQLIKQDKIFACNCTRKKLQNQIHNNICLSHLNQPHSWRLKSSDQNISFLDIIQGPQNFNLLNEIGHPILKRKDNEFSYLLAVVVDDYQQHISHIIRGEDLLDTTASQIYLFTTLGWQIPQYGHIPIVQDQKQLKLSKQNHAPAIAKGDPKTLLNALEHLHIYPENTSDIATMLQQAIRLWSSSQLKKIP